MRSKRNRSAPKDFHQNMLPQTRKALFFDVLKLQWSKLLSLGFILLVSALPLLGLWIYQDISMIYLADQADVPSEQIIGEMVSLQNTNALLSIPAILLLFVGLSAIMRPLRQLAWGENLVLSYDLGVGLKQNFRYGILCGLIMAVAYASAKIGWTTATIATSTFSFLFSLPMCLLFLLLPIFGYMLVTICVYVNRFTTNIKVAIVLYGKHPLQTLLMTVATIAIPGIWWFIPHLYVHLFGGILGILLFPIGLFGWMLFTFNKLDEDINPKHFPDLVGKGIV